MSDGVELMRSLLSTGSRTTVCPLRAGTAQRFPEVGLSLAPAMTAGPALDGHQRFAVVRSRACAAHKLSVVVVIREIGERSGPRRTCRFQRTVRRRPHEQGQQMADGIRIERLAAEFGIPSARLMVWLAKQDIAPTWETGVLDRAVAQQARAVFGRQRSARRSKPMDDWLRTSSRMTRSVNRSLLDSAQAMAGSPAAARTRG